MAVGGERGEVEGFCMFMAYGRGFLHISVPEVKMCILQIHFWTLNSFNTLILGQLKLKVGDTIA